MWSGLCVQCICVYVLPTRCYCSSVVVDVQYLFFFFLISDNWHQVNCKVFSYCPVIKCHVSVSLSGQHCHVLVSVYPISISQCSCGVAYGQFSSHRVFSLESRISLLLQIAIFTFKKHLIEEVGSILILGQFMSNKFFFINK